MPAYIQGNLAIDKNPRHKVTIKETRKVVVRHKSLPVQEKMLYLFTVLLCVIVAGVIIWRYAQIYQMNANMLKIQQDIRQMQAENSSLKQEVEMLKSIPRLEEEAQKLGLKPQHQDEQVAQVTPGKSVKNNDSTKVALNP
jgi:cell division protein FtsL